jgi:hypothetical protein
VPPVLDKIKDVQDGLKVQSYSTLNLFSADECEEDPEAAEEK